MYMLGMVLMMYTLTTENQCMVLDMHLLHG